MKYHNGDYGGGAIGGITNIFVTADSQSGSGRDGVDDASGDHNSRKWVNILVPSGKALSGICKGLRCVGSLHVLLVTFGV